MIPLSEETREALVTASKAWARFELGALAHEVETLMPVEPYLCPICQEPLWFICWPGTTPSSIAITVGCTRCNLIANDRLSSSGFQLTKTQGCKSAYATYREVVALIAQDIPGYVQKRSEYLRTH